ncbi:cation:proton antiporter [Candidatus Uhrbacteria bacterium]|nr:cation:proton antiporter [Candidatus Uhrbacteria bacterium]
MLGIALALPFGASAESVRENSDDASARVAVLAEPSADDGGRRGAPETVHEESGAAEGHVDYAFIFGAIALLIVAAKLGTLVERVGQPAVLGEIVVGLLLGNLALVGVPFFRELAGNALLGFLAELGVVILLFQIGLESDLKKLGKVGVPAFLVAVIGVVVPMVLGWKVIGPWLFPGQSAIAYLFLGAAMTATSVGITARVFQDLGKLQTKAAQIVLGAAVMDDVFGLLILAVVSGIATTGAVSGGAIGFITVKALGFLVVAVVLGRLLANSIGTLFSKIHSGVGMKLGLALAFAFAFASAAQIVGLAPIVGAFAAGLILDPVVFQRFRGGAFLDDLKGFIPQASTNEAREGLDRLVRKYEHRHIEDLVEPIAHFLVPVFFVLTGMRVDLGVLSDPSVVLVAVGVSLTAIAGKIVAGVGASKGSRLLVGIGMIPRGEVGLIFANIGKSLGVISDALFAVVVIMVVVTTLITPPLLALLLKRSAQATHVS